MENYLDIEDPIYTLRGSTAFWTCLELAFIQKVLKDDDWAALLSLVQYENGVGFAGGRSGTAAVNKTTWL